MRRNDLDALRHLVRMNRPTFAGLILSRVPNVERILVHRPRENDVAFLAAAFANGELDVPVYSAFEALHARALFPQARIVYDGPTGAILAAEPGEKPKIDRDLLTLYADAVAEAETERILAETFLGGDELIPGGFVEEAADLPRCRCTVEIETPIAPEKASAIRKAWNQGREIARKHLRFNPQAFMSNRWYQPKPLPPGVECAVFCLACARAGKAAQHPIGACA